MKKTLLAIALLTVLAGSVPAQVSPPNPRSTEILLKIAKLDALIQIVPLALTKDEYPPILSAIERVRQKQRELETIEAKDLTGIDALVSKGVDDGIGKEAYPPHETQNQVASLMRAMGLRRSLFYNESVENVFTVCKATLNEGQLKAMEKSLKPEALGSDVKGAEMDSDTKIKFFVRKVLLDPIAYDILVEMSKKKAAEG